MAQIGHYGTPSLVAGGLAIVLLVLHLAVPFGVLVPAADEFLQPENEVVSRGDMAEGYSDIDGYGPASPGATLTGIIIAMVAGILLIGIGFVPVPTLVARFAGWSLAFLGAAGALTAAFSSGYWAGQFLTVLLEAVTDPLGLEGGNHAVFWAISPLIVLAGAIVMLVMFLRIMTHVIAKRDGLRDSMALHMRGVKFAAILLLLVVSMPWAMQFVGGEDRRNAGLCDATETCQPSLQFYTAIGHGTSDAAQPLPYGGILAFADVTQDAPEPLFQGLAFSIKVLTAVGWVGFLLGGLTTAGHLLSSAFKLPAAAKYAPAMLIGNLIMALWGAIMFILANSYQWRPSWDKDAFFAGPIKDVQIWTPGWFALVAVGTFLVLWALGQWRLVRPVFGERGAAVRSEKAVTFD